MKGKLLLLLAIIVLVIGLIGCSTGGDGGELATYTVSGRVVDGSGQGLAGIIIGFSGSFGSALTDAEGEWSKSGLSGTVTVTPVKIGWDFVPSSRTVTEAASNINFTGTEQSGTSIGSAGGTVTIGNAVLVIPPGALSQTVDFTALEVISAPAGYLGAAYDFGPDGTQFATPAVLTIQYNQADLPAGMTEDELLLGVVEDGNWVPLVSTLDTVGNTVSAEISHLSIYGLLAAGDGSEYTISGKVVDGYDGLGMSGVTITFSGGFASVVTDNDGSWSKSGLSGLVTVTPVKEDMLFFPESRQVYGPDQEIDFSERRLTILEVNPTTVSLQIGQTQTITAVGYDQYGNQFPCQSSWSVSGNIGSVNPQSGASTTFTAEAGGSGEVRATASYYTDTASITVEPGSLLIVPDQYPTIQDAIDIAADGAIIEVKPGIYEEELNYNGKAITIKSTNPDAPVIVDSTVIKMDPSIGGNIFTFESGETAASVLEGFTIMGRNGARGIYIFEASPTIRKNVITGCITGGSANDGAAIYMTRESAPLIENNTITGNSVSNDVSNKSYGGAISIYDSSPVIRGNTISDNYSEDYGGAIAVRGSISSPVIENNTISGNQTPGAGGGIYIIDSSYLEISGNQITDNEAVEISEQYGTLVGGAGGGIYLYKSSPLIDNNTIQSNYSKLGGGIFISGYDQTTPVQPEISNNDISNNDSYQAGGGIRVSSYAEPFIYGNTISGNSPERGVGSGITIGATCEAKGSAGTFWPRLDSPPEVELNNSYSFNGDQQADDLTGFDVYFTYEP